MIKRIILISIAVFSLSAYCQEPPKEVKETIDRDLPGILKEVFDEDKTEWNFSAEDGLDQITVSDPFVIRGIDSQDFQEALKTSSVKSISSYNNMEGQAYTWHAIVKVNDIGKWIIDVDVVDSKWRIVGYGGDSAAEDFNKIFKLYGQKEIIIFGNSPINQYYYHITNKGEKNLTAINHEKMSLLKKANQYENKNAFENETDISKITEREISRMNSKNRSTR